MPWAGDFFVDMAKQLERACFDYLIVEDKCHVSDAYGRSIGRHECKC